ncbi:protein ASPARTIC PROTEASE IN GUARD CELL 1-like [Hibiscus syriacus]|uniref:Protein ASPARTIC PROTEASE IN GUARD CELL 1-like n=1 Tax=Hibiscus syriacus TaxID=106335 RepID=A0A6A3CRN7_HIBSY|nr:chaperone protein DnaJ-like [Hibiscus syriacus]KAE8731656.1 protein ASPARTIC PROTEASE IN GUARD CELL 1-like [Hibiscus syriacus]
MKGCAICYRPVIVGKSIDEKGMSFVSTNRLDFGAVIGKTVSARSKGSRVLTVRASAVDSYESSSDFVKRMEKAWAISQQPRPIVCSSCDSKGNVECQWCRGTGFFILGDNMLCQVPSRNTSCVICAGEGSKCCSDCQGTGFRAKWMGEPPISK